MNQMNVESAQNQASGQAPRNSKKRFEEQILITRIDEAILFDNPDLFKDLELT